MFKLNLKYSKMKNLNLITFMLIIQNKYNQNLINIKNKWKNYKKEDRFYQ